MKLTQILFSIGVGVAAFLSTTAAAAAAAEPSLVKGANFDRFLVIILENTDFPEAKALPFLGSLSSSAVGGVALTNYKALTHPSQPNYVYMIAGTRHWILLDFDQTVKGKKTIVDLLEAKGVSWKAYMQGYSGKCNTASSIGEYRRKHNPFISFDTITNNAARCAKIVPAEEIEADIANNSLPQFMFYSPDMRNDGHDTSPDFADNWLKSFLEPKLKNPAFMENTVVLVTYDESENYFNNNQVFSVLVGGAVQRSFPAGSPREDNTAYNHFSILKTVEDNWNLGNLGQKDVTGVPFAIKDKKKSLLRNV